MDHGSSARPRSRRAHAPISSVVVAASDLSTAGAFDVATRETSEIAPPSFPATGPFVAGFDGKRVLFVGPGQVVAFDVGTGAWREAAQGLTEPPDHVAWTQPGYGLSVSGNTLAAYRP